MTLATAPAYADRVDIAKEKDTDLVLFAARHAREEVFRALEVGPLEARGLGCGRVYVNFGKLRDGGKAMKIIEKELSQIATFRGLSCRKFTKRPNSSYKQFYIGYDNNTGIELAVGKIIADAFNLHGFHAYRDEDGD